MFAVVHLILIGVLAHQLQFRGGLLEDFKGLPRYLLSVGLTLFLVNWADFLLYAILGWGRAYEIVTWSGLVAAVLYGMVRPRETWEEDGPRLMQGVLAYRQWNYWFLFLAGFVLLHFYFGLYEDRAGQIWCNFNLLDAPFHLSVVNAFVESPRFPPVDLDMPPYPMKYHFIADFYVAHLVRLGLSALKAMWLVNLVSAAAMVGALWACFAHWLKLPARWVMLAGLIFLCLNPAIPNLVHFLALHPPYFNPADPYDGIVAFPYFNFEYSLYNLLEPQRGLLFTLPVVLLVLHAAFGQAAAATPDDDLPSSRGRILSAFLLVCLLPLSHVVAFAVLALALLPGLWAHRRWFFSRAWWWAPVFILGVLQLLYLQAYGPPTNTSFSSWDVASALPLHDFDAFPAWTRRIVFWFFIDGDFLVWGALFAGLAVAQRRAKPAGNRLSPWQFLTQWKWYFAACGFFFLLINLYRYSFAWGDSNKFVFFLNLGLALLITVGAAQWRERRGRVVSALLWGFFFVLCTAVPAFEFGKWVIVSPHGKFLLFSANERLAATWLKQVEPRSSIVLTAAYQTYHFVTPLAGLPTPAGIYADSNPYRQEGRDAAIRRVYEEGDFTLLSKLNIRYVCLSVAERRTYRLSPVWTALMTSGRGLAFQAGTPEDAYSVFIFDAAKLRAP